jgi:hypothetical protein
MTKFKIFYSFEGEGTVIVEARNPQEAKTKYYDGEYFEDEQESGENYVIRTVILLAKK